MFITFFSCNSSRQVDLIIEKGNVFLDHDNNKIWVIHTNLENNTSDTLRYVSMYCSYEDLYTVNNQKLEIHQSNCDKNFPIILTLAPGQKKTSDIKIKSNDNKQLKEFNLKIGLYLIKVDKFIIIPDHSFLRNLQNYNVIWSNEISL